MDTYLQYSSLTLKEFSSIDVEARNYLVNQIGDFEVKRVLDVGCGAGLSLLPFADKKNSVCFGIDIGAEIGKIGPATFREQGFEGKGFFCRSMGEDLPFADESFDFVICCLALPYMDNHKTLSEISRVLRPNGRFFLKIHAPLFYWEMIKERAKTLNPKQLAFPFICLFGGLINQLTGKHPQGNFWRGKEVYQTRQSILKELEKRGFKVIKEPPDSNPATPSFIVEKVKNYKDL